MRMLSACAGFLLAAASAFGSCGSASCPIELHGLMSEVGHITLDLSLQSIDQNHRQGLDLPSHHFELRTINRIASLQFGYAPNANLRWIVTAPYVSRVHDHIENATGDFERWNFGALGDVALQARYRPIDHLSLIGGVKLPTGAKHELDVTGAEEAEVPLQPGTGSTDVTAGVSYDNGFLRNTVLEGPLGHATFVPYFASLVYRANGRGTHDYRRGNEIQLNVGTEYPLAKRANVLVQINGRLTGKDAPGSTGENPDLTGGRYLYLSPGLRVSITDASSAYAYVQLPLLQRVNGLQLTSRANFLAGIHHRF